MVNVYDSANQLAEDLQKTPEYAALKQAVAQVKQDEKSKAMFKKMDSLQSKIIKAQQTGKQLPKEEQQAYKDLNAKVQKDKNIVNMLQKEQGVYKLLDDVQKTFTRPINDLYTDLRD